MAFTTPRTWVAGEVVTAAIMNLHLRDQLNFLTNPPRATAYASAAQNQPTNNTFVTINFDAEHVDTDNMHNTVTNNSRLTCVTAGKYEVNGQITFSSNATNRRAGRVIVNGVTAGGPYGQTESTTSAVAVATTTVVIPTIEITLAVNDYVELQGFQGSGAALAYAVGPWMTFLRAKWIGV